MSGNQPDRSSAEAPDTPPTPQPPQPPSLSRASTSSLKKCWICIGTEDEDDPIHPPRWVAPCKCTLAAHETCLLDWVADLENPRNRRSPNSASDTILCPQCKHEIKIARPRNLLVEALRKVDRAAGRLVLPGLAASLMGTLWAGCWTYGHTAVFVVFGREDALRVWSYAWKRPIYDFAYGLIPLNLIFARTRYSDFVLPSGTLFLLATQLNEGDIIGGGGLIDWTIWPPLPSTVFACLPAVRQLYNFSYDKMFGKLNKKWIAEVQPRREEGYGNQEQNIADIINQQEQEMAFEGEDNAGVVLELELNLGGGNGDDDDDEEEDFPVNVGNGPNNLPDGNNANRDDGGNAQQAQAQEQAQAVQNGHVHRLLGDNELLDDTSSIGQTVMGALIFPAVAAGVGELLKVALPSSWTSPLLNLSTTNGRRGLMSSKWGRSVVGGCLFVVLKDALLLYCRWRLARGHQQRRIMDYDKIQKRYTLDP